MTPRARAEIVAANMTAPADDYYRKQLAIVLERAIAEAVQAETERCAKIAEGWAADDAADQMRARTP
jgi:predicted transcriptional regulator